MGLQTALISNMLNSVVKATNASQKVNILEVSTGANAIAKNMPIQLDDDGKAYPAVALSASSISAFSVAQPASTVSTSQTELFDCGSGFYLKVFGDSASTTSNRCFLYEWDETTSTLIQRHTLTITGLSGSILPTDNAVHGLFEQISDTNFVYCSNTTFSSTPYTLKFLIVDKTAKTIVSTALTFSTATISTLAAVHSSLKKVRDNVFLFHYSTSGTSSAEYVIFSVNDDASAFVNQTLKQSGAVIFGIVKAAENVLILNSTSHVKTAMFFDDTSFVPTFFNLQGSASVSADAIYSALGFLTVSKTTAFVNSRPLSLVEKNAFYAFSFINGVNPFPIVRVSLDKQQKTTTLEYYTEKNNNGFNVGYSYNLMHIDDDTLLLYAANIGDYGTYSHHYVAKVLLNHTDKTYEVVKLLKLPLLALSSDTGAHFTTKINRLGADRFLLSRYSAASLDAFVLPLNLNTYTQVDAVALDNIPANSSGTVYCGSGAIYMPTQTAGEMVLDSFKMSSTGFAVKRLR